jgi:hypothetical protein
MESEIIDNLKEKMDITVVKKILEENKTFLEQIEYINNNDFV